MANFTGTPRADTFDGTPQADTANTRGGNDIANGRGGDDILRGEAGDDTLSGGGGVDRLSGGAGSDTLFGGAGNDVFAFPDSDGVPSVDRIRDFDRGADVLSVDVEFSQLDSDGNGTLNNADAQVEDRNGVLTIDYANGEELALSGIRQLNEADFLS